MTYVVFRQEVNKVIVTESIEAESLNSKNMQYQGWKAIMENFKKIEQEFAHYFIPYPFIFLLPIIPLMRYFGIAESNILLFLNRKRIYI